jgi:hypothetical protein
MKGTLIRGLGDLGQTFQQSSQQIASSIAGLIGQGILPNQPNIISSAINVAVGVWQAKEQAKMAEAQAKIATAQAEIARQTAMAEEGVPIYKKVWFWPLLGAVAVFLFKGGAALFERRRYRKNPLDLSTLLPLAAGGVAIWLLTKKEKPLAPPPMPGGPKESDRLIAQAEALESVGQITTAMALRAQADMLRRMGR